MRSNDVMDAMDKAAQLSATFRTDETTRDRDLGYLYGCTETIYALSGVAAFGIPRNIVRQKIANRIEAMAQTKYGAPYALIVNPDPDI